MEFERFEEHFDDGRKRTSESESRKRGRSSSVDIRCSRPTFIPTFFASNTSRIPSPIPRLGCFRSEARLLQELSTSFFNADIIRVKPPSWLTRIVESTRKYLAAPTGVRMALRSYRDIEQMNRLFILYLMEDGNSNAISFEVVEHEIELVRHPSKMFARQIRTVVTPIIGNFDVGTFCGISVHGTVVLWGNTIADESKLAIFDRKLNVTFRLLHEYKRELRASPIGQRMLAAEKDFVAILPSEDEATEERVYMFMFGDMVLCLIDDVFVRRYLHPPSLLFQAAEKICRLRPNADLSALVNEIGFDGFDGILEEKKKPPMVVKLSSNLSMLD